MNNISISFDNLKPISKQQGVKISRYGGYLTKSYSIFKEEIFKVSKSKARISGWRINEEDYYEINYTLYWPEHNKPKDRVGDLADNVVSGIIDAIKGTLIYDDKNIVSVNRGTRIFTQKLRRIELTITKVEPERSNE